MLLLCERRGPQATGIALLKNDGNYHLFKRPKPAALFIYEPMYRSILADLDSNTTLLMGHTRLPTCGDPSDNRNNHPIRAGVVIGTHNGTIYNADRLFRKFKLPRYSEVDSELIFRLADRFAVNGGVDLIGLMEALALCRGQMSAVLASCLEPGVVAVLKGNKPLSMAYSPKMRAVLYASQADFITLALGETKGWRGLEIPAMTAMTFRCTNLKEVRIEKFSLKHLKKRSISIKGESS
jgi:glucosamine 6-phosphate synthetase-like amidotransferase/phosphosugar isomerase protein